MTVIALFVSAAVAFGVVNWRRGSDRASCILNIRNVQQAVRSHSGVKGLIIGDPIVWSEILGPVRYLSRPSCPAHGTYRFLDTVPKVGELAMECSLCKSVEKHEPPSHADW